MTLEQLQEMGAVDANLVVVKSYKATTVSEYGKYSDEEKTEVQAVVLDNSVWVATPDRIAPVRADVVYSYDGTNFGFWNRKNSTFSIMELVNDSLVTTKLFSISKGEQDMAEINMDGLNIDLNSKLKEAQANDPRKMNLGDTTAKPKKSEAEKEQDKKERAQKRAAQERAIEGQVANIKKLVAAANKDFEIDSKYIENNRRKGRLLGFFTATDPVVKVSLKQTPINDGTDQAPHYPLRPGVNLDKELEAKYANGTKNIGTKYIQCKSDIAFRQAGPSTVVAGIVKTPAMTEITDISELTSGKRVWSSDCATDTSTVLRVLPKEALFAYLELNYDKKIQEDESIHGSTTIEVERTSVKSKEATGTAATTTSFRSRIKADGRSLFTPGNYFPLETYDTVILGAATSEQDKEYANNNFAAIIKQHAAAPRKNSKGEMSAAKGDFSSEALAMITRDDAKSNPAKGLYVCTSSVVDGGATVQCKTFNSKGKNVQMMDVTELPVRVVKEHKDGNSVSYVYSKSKFNDGVNPAINRTEYQEFIQRVTAAAGAGTDFESIATKAASAKRTVNRASNKIASASERISGIQMLAMRANSAVKIDNKEGGDQSLDRIFEMFKSAAV